MTDGKCDPAGTLTQAIRNFAKSLEGWLTSAMTDFPQEIVRTKVCVCVCVSDLNLKEKFAANVLRSWLKQAKLHEEEILKTFKKIYNLIFKTLIYNVYY